jgi:uncharacterized protein YecT (DUF1311 family)
MGKRLFVFIFLLALWFPQSDAAPGTICASAVTTVDMIDCSKKELAKATEQLRALEARIISKLKDEESVALFNRATVAWVTYLDSDCQSEAALYKGGTVQPVILLGCKIHLTNERIGALSKSYDVLLR